MEQILFSTHLTKIAPASPLAKSFPKKTQALEPITKLSFLKPGRSLFARRRNKVTEEEGEEKKKFCLTIDAERCSREFLVPTNEKITKLIIIIIGSPEMPKK